MLNWTLVHFHQLTSPAKLWYHLFRATGSRPYEKALLLRTLGWGFWQLSMFSRLWVFSDPKTLINVYYTYTRRSTSNMRPFRPPLGPSGVLLLLLLLVVVKFKTF